MKKIILTVTVVLLVTNSVQSQQTSYTLFKYDSYIPHVEINDRSASLQAAVYPDLYKSRAAEKDMDWVQNSDSALIALWQQKGDTILHILTELSGIDWREAEFEIYLVRHFPTVGSPDPLVIPIGGIGFKGLLEAVPMDDRLTLNLVYQLSRRMLTQVERANDPVSFALLRHPLMRPTAFRRDNMAMLLALVTCQNVLGYEAANKAFESEFWDRHFLPKQAFRKYLMNNWVLSPEKTLADKIVAEPRNSDLIAATRPPRPPRPNTDGQLITQIAGISPTGKLGFSIRYESGNALVIDTIDDRRLAYANGLRTGDQIKRIDGHTVRSYRDLVGKLLAGLENGAAEVEIIRSNKMQMLTFQPKMLPVYEEKDFYFEEYQDGDSTAIEDFGSEDE